MDFVPRGPTRPANGLRIPRAWAALATLGLLLSPHPWTFPASGGDTPTPANPAPAASHDGSAPAKAQVASAPHDSNSAQRVLEADPIARARQVIADCKTKYQSVQDYTCTFFKRERIDGKLYTPHIMTVKARTKPSSLYFKFIQPNAGREAIYIHGQNNNKIIAHDVGLGRVVAGTMHLDPKGGMAMEENRHPVTEAGLGSMIDTVKERWDSELHPGESIVTFHPHAKVGDRPCLMVETTHPRPGPDFLFHKVKFYVDKELGLPIRFEAYDWPKRPGAEPELIEEYTYMSLRVNVGLKDRDFDPNNRQYSYGRF